MADFQASLQVTGDDLWVLFETEFAFIPEELKLILKAMKYDNLFSLERFSQEDRKKIELFMQTTLHHIIEKEEREKYYGIFKDHPEKFVFLGGIEHAMNEIVRLAKKIMASQRRFNHSREPRSDAFSPISSKGQRTQDSETSAVDIIVDLKSILDTNVNKYLAETYPNVSLPTVSANVAADGLGSHFAILQCPIAGCEKSTKITRNKKRWNTSNFYSHVSTHSSKKNPDKSTISIAKMFAKMQERSLSQETDQNLSEPLSDQTNQKIEKQNVLKRKRIEIRDSSSEDETESTVADAGSGEGNRVATFLHKTQIQSSRSKRNERKLNAAAENCNKITEYLPILNKIDLILKENEDLKKKLVLSMAPKPQSANQPKDLNNMLKLLLECALDNADKKPNGRRYSNVIKELAFLIYSIGGLSIYEFLSKNLSLPSISTVRKKIYSNSSLVEGEFRIKELKTYLKERNYPLKVHISEDATRVDGRIQYHSASNQIVGFTLPLDVNGVPIVGSYPATSAEKICNYFENCDTSNYVYCIIAQPLCDRSAVFCLAMFGTNNKFNSLQVTKRWQWMKEKCSEEGIEIVGFSSDGDTRLLKAMNLHVITSKTDTSWKWFQANKEVDQICIQDQIHIGTKLKSRYLKPSIILPLGKKFVISRGHLVELIEKTSKDQHQLCMSDINPKDKMNYRAVQKMCDVKVTTLLRSEVTNSEGTATYLDMMREVVEAYVSVDLKPLERIEKIWEWVFFLRMWRSWVSKQDGYSLGNNFITSNVYYCIEINAHCLIQAIIKFRNSKEPNLFLPWLLSSQPCETTFRRLRSTTVSHCGVVSFSILDLQNHFRRIDLLASTYLKLGEEFVFSRHHKAVKTSDALPYIPTSLPEDSEIETAVMISLRRAIKRATDFELIKKVPATFIPKPDLRYLSSTEVDTNQDDLFSEDHDDDLGEQDNILMDNFEQVIDDTEDDSEINSALDREDNLNDLLEDLFIVSTGALGIKTFNHVNVTEASPFVRVSDGNGNPAVIKKQTLVWLRSSGNMNMNSDRLQRVKADLISHKISHKTFSCSKELEYPHREQFISVGDWCAFTSEDKSIVIGRILAFSYLTGLSRKNQEYSKISAPINAPEHNARGLGAMCSWFNIEENKILTLINMDVHGYYDIKNYICTVPRPQIEENKFKLLCSLNSILNVSSSV